MQSSCALSTALEHQQQAPNERNEPIQEDLHLIQRRQVFLRLLRQGIYDQITRHTAPQVTTNNNFSNATHVPEWHSLWWRNAWAGERFFCEQIDGHTMRIQQLQQGELNGLGTGATVWPAACVLIKCLEYHFGRRAIATGNTLTNKQVLELGSGTGAVGIAAALLGARGVVVTDMPILIPLMQANVDSCRTAFPTVDIDVQPYEWGTTPSPELQHADLILVSDCILPKLYPIEPLVTALSLLTGTSNTRIWISFEQRYFPQFDPKVRFWTLMQAKGFELRVLDLAELHPHYRAADIEIWEITRPICL